MKLVTFVFFALCSLLGASRVSTQTKSKTRVRTRTRARRVRRVHEINGSLAAEAGESDDAGGDNDDDESDDADTNDDEVPPALVTARENLLDAQWKQKSNAATLDHFKDVKAFDSEIDREAAVVSNETQSPGLAHFLAAIRDEMRTYAAPSYTSHLESQEKRLAAEEKALAAKVAALENRSSPSKPSVVKVDSKPAAVPDATAKALAADEAEIKELKEKQEAAVTEAGHVFAFAFLGTITMISMVFAMANTQGDGTVRNYTWFLMDQVTAIFLAVMYFQAFDDLLDFMDFGGHRETLAAVVHAVFMLTLALALAYILQKKKMGLAILCGCSAHIVSFTSIHAAAVVQNNFWLGFDFHWGFALIGLVALGLALALIGSAVWKAKHSMGVSGDDNFMDKTDDVENDFGAMAFSVCWTMFVRFLLTGHHPEDDETEFDHTATQRNMMLAYGFVALFASGFMVRYCSRMADDSKSYFVKRVATFFNTVAAMNVAWAFFYYAEWELFETVFVGQPIFGRIAYALLCTIAGALGIFGLSRLHLGDKALTREKQVALTALSLMVAWSWELCFDAAVDDMAEGRHHPALYKMAATVFMFITVIPVYVKYLKPTAMKYAEQIG